jgi:hypothetical protein
MHKTPSTHARRIFSALFAAIALFLFTGCEMTVTNLTPDSVPANPSQIYTITLNVIPKSSNIPRDSVQPRIIIDGSSFAMVKSATGKDLWEFEYQLPAGRTNAAYYFIVDYVIRNDGDIPRETYTELYNLTIAGRYVLRPEATRAPSGARVSVLGAGFTPSDVVYFDHTPARTVFESPSSLSFFVPAVEPGRNYQLKVAGGGPEQAVGTFRVDALSLTVEPGSLALRTGEQQAVTFTIPTPAPAGGMLIDVTTDIPDSVVMPEVIVPAGQTHATIPVQGGKPGTGSLFYKTSTGEGSIPVSVTAK